MCLPVLVINKDVIKEYKNKVAKKGPNNRVQEDLKRGWGIAKTKRHHYKLLLSFMCMEISLRNVDLFYWI
jgi:hypothetical protein